MKERRCRSFSFSDRQSNGFVSGSDTEKSSENREMDDPMPSVQIRYYHLPIR